MPSIFVSHGTPTILDGADGTAVFLRQLGQSLGRPQAIVCVTAHWQTEVPTVGSAIAPATIGQSAGAPQPSYPASGAIGIAADVVAALRNAGIPCAVDPRRGLDRATWGPLMLMYPKADVPVAQLSVQPDAGGEHHLAIGRALAPLHRAGTMIMGSGASVHNPAQRSAPCGAALEWADRFQEWLIDAVQRGAADDIAAFEGRNDATLAHPTGEHLMPLLVAMGAAGSKGRLLHAGLRGGLGLAAFSFADDTEISRTAPALRQTRLRRHERERLIIDEAISFFAEHGLDGQTRALAERLGITQPLLYRYFPNKDALLARVFDEVFSRRWRPEWETTIVDRSRPFGERVREFVESYCRSLCHEEWVRLLFSSGLRGGGFDRRVLHMVAERLIKPLAQELRAEYSRGEIDGAGRRATDLAWALHGSMMEIAIRTWLHGVPAPTDFGDLAVTLAHSFLAGAEAVLGGAQTAISEPVE